MAARRLNPIVVAAAVAALLTACRTVPIGSGATMTWAQRCAQLQQAGSYSFTGRIGVSAAGQGVSAAVDWRQQGTRAQASLRGPLGLGAIELELDGEQLTLRDPAGRVLDADALGFELPLQQLPHWLVACSARPGGDAASTATVAAPAARLQEGEWVIEYSDYRQSGRYLLPGRIRAVAGGDRRLQMSISRWQIP